MALTGTWIGRDYLMLGAGDLATMRQKEQEREVREDGNLARSGVSGVLRHGAMMKGLRHADISN